MRKITTTLVLLSLALLLTTTVYADGPAARSTPPNPDNVEFTEIASGFDRLLHVTVAHDDTNRLFAVEQGGRIWVIEDGELLSPAFLDLSEQVSGEANSPLYTERGLLGLAFSPDYEESGEFYVNYTDVNGNSIVSRFTVSEDANVADADSETVLLVVEQPFPNHNGGHLDFGPDGYLYVSLGDGGAGGDPQDNGQNPETLLGTILRLDVVSQETYTIPEDNPFADGEGGAPEVWAYGLRNVWRFSFDRETGDMYLGDVGQNQWEEINFQPADSPGGENYGWNIYEGLHPFSGEEAPEDMVLPIAEYNHSEGISVTGGFVYRGAAIPDLQDAYLYGDFGSGRLWTAYINEAGEWQSELFTVLENVNISSFGQDEAGELYITDYRNGRVLKITPAE